MQGPGDISAETHAEVLKAIKVLEFKIELSEVLELMSVDVVEAYSLPRVAKVAGQMGLKPGESMDLTTGWDFTLERHRQAAIDYVNKVKPRLVIGSPMCTMFSALQHLSKNERRPGWEDKFAEAKRHIEFVVELYEIQWRAGRLFLHEHPATATSWDLECIRQLESKFGVVLTRADQCMYGLETYGKQGEAKAAKKATKFLTNIVGIGKGVAEAM